MELVVVEVVVVVSVRGGVDVRGVLHCCRHCCCSCCCRCCRHCSKERAMYGASCVCRWPCCSPFVSLVSLIKRAREQKTRRAEDMEACVCVPPHPEGRRKEREKGGMCVDRPGQRVKIKGKKRKEE